MAGHLWAKLADSDKASDGHRETIASMELSHTESTAELEATIAEIREANTKLEHDLKEKAEGLDTATAEKVGFRSFTAQI